MFVIPFDLQTVTRDNRSCIQCKVHPTKDGAGDKGKHTHLLPNHLAYLSTYTCTHSRATVLQVVQKTRQLFNFVKSD